MTVGMAFLLVLSASHLGCLSRTHMPYCEVVYEGPVSDDEETPIGSVDALLDHVLLDQELPAVWADDVRTLAHVEVRRGEGSAFLLEQVQATRVTERRKLGPGYDFYPAINMPCSDRLSVPLELQVRTADGDLDVGMQATAQTETGMNEESEPWVTGARAAAPDEIPAFDGEELPAGVEQLELKVRVLANQGDVLGGEVTWTGREEGEDPESVTGRVLSFWEDGWAP